jgi:hypothetical protein
VSADAAVVPGAYRFDVHMAYYLLDPTDKELSWLNANALLCPLTSTPRFAYLQSYGTGANVAGAGGAPVDAATGRRPPCTGSPCRWEHRGRAAAAVPERTVHRCRT